MIKNFIISGAGGQGVISIGGILANIFMLEEYFVSFCSCYGAEMRGGAVNCEINMSDNELFCIENELVDYVVVLNQTSFEKFISRVKPNGTMIVNSTLTVPNKPRDDIKYIFAPMTTEVLKIGSAKMTNSFALGILTKLLGGYKIENIKKAYENVLKMKHDLIEKNIEAYLLGYNYI